MASLDENGTGEQEPSRIRMEFADYELLEEIGRGGQGVVYRARQKSLNRTVALKVIGLGQWSSTPHLKRFRHEAEAAASLEHPQIVPIYEIGERDGSCYFSMKFVEGGRLDDVVKREPMSARRAAELLVKIARTVQFAHENGILHRDIKPGNILLDRHGEPHLTDFGLARLIEQESTITNSFEVLGTPSYMPPEQAEGHAKELTPAADVYSLGAAFYHMLTGEPPFAGGTTYETIRMVLEAEPRNPRTRNARIDVDLATICLKCLEKNPAHRYQSAAALADDVERWLKHEPICARRTGMFSRGRKWVRRNPTSAFLAVSLLAFAAAVGWIVWKSELLRQPVSIGVAVLPFKPLVAADRDEVLEAGMADTLIAKLSASREMNVPSLAAARKYDDETHDPVASGGALRVSSVLEGNLQKSGDHIRVTARLIRVADRKLMWSGTFDEKFTDVFQVEDAIAEKVAAALKLHLSDEDQQRLTKRHTEKPEAYQAYLTGRFYWHKFTPKGWRKSIEFFKQAAAKDPNYALAYAGIAESYSLLAETADASPREIFPQARTYAEKALKLDDTLSEAHLALGIVELFYDWNLTAAKVKLEHARELNSSDPQVHHFYGHYLQWAGRYEEAAAEMKRGVDLDPTNLVINAEYGWTFYLRRQHDEALAHYRKTLELDPNFVLASVWIAQALEQKRMYGEAMAELERARKIDDWSWIVAEIGCVNALSNKREEARKVVAELIARSAHEYIDETLIAYIFVALGDTDQTFAWLNKAYESRGGNLPWITMEPKFDSIRSDPRFGALLRRMRLR